MVPGVELSDSLSIGEALVAGGTLALALFTWRLARITAVLDERNASRDRKRHERKVRGVARLIDGELQVVATSLDQAVKGNAWHWLYATPHAAWDRDGALIVETVAEDEAVALIDFHARLGAWETIIAWTHQQFPSAIEMGLKPEQAGIVSDLLARLSDRRRDLGPLAYPDARDLEPDPDSLLEYRREHPAWRRTLARLRAWRNH